MKTKILGLVVVVCFLVGSGAQAADLNKVEMRGTPVEIQSTLGLQGPIFGIIKTKVLVYVNAPVQGGSDLIWIECSPALANWCGYAPNLLTCAAGYVELQGPDPTNPNQFLDTFVCQASGLQSIGSCHRMTGYTKSGGPLATNFFADTTCSPLP